MNNSRPAKPAAHRDGRRNDVDYKALTIALLNQIEDSFAHRMIYEIVCRITKHIDDFTH